jgi:hypothetical protein
MWNDLFDRFEPVGQRSWKLNELRHHISSVVVSSGIGLVVIQDARQHLLRKEVLHGGVQPGFYVIVEHVHYLNDGQNEDHPPHRTHRSCTSRFGTYGIYNTTGELWNYDLSYGNYDQTHHSEESQCRVRRREKTKFHQNRSIRRRLIFNTTAAFTAAAAPTTATVRLFIFVHHSLCFT